MRSMIRAVIIQIIVFFFLLCLFITPAKAQTNQGVSLSDILTVTSNLVAIANELKSARAEATPQTVATNPVVLTSILYSNGIPIQTNSTTSLPTNIEQKAVDWYGIIFKIAVSLFGIARILRKVIPDKLQNNIVGETIAHAALEINPALNQTKPTGA